MSIRTPSSWRRRCAAVALGSLVLACGLLACGEGGSQGEELDEVSSDATRSPSAGGDDGGDAGGDDGATDEPAKSPSVADPEHSVNPPGPRRGALVGADLLIKSREKIADDLAAKIADTRGVQGTVGLTLADVGVQNRVLNVAAVDPGTYRNYTPYESAELQAQWDRVAGGEIALADQALARRVADDEGWLNLGSGDDAPKLHVGATAPQVAYVDAVVNEKWGEALGMPMGNAMLVTTGLASPQVVMKRLQKAVGDTAAVSILGPDLDPGAFFTAVPTGGSVAEAIGTFRYTVIGGGRIQPEPSWVGANIVTEAVPILGSVTCHRVMMTQLRAALIDIQAAGLADEIYPDQYAGCYYPRFIAGSSQLSNHSYGIAVDLNVPGNQRGTVGEIHRSVVDIFKKWGFGWGGDWSYTDPMHFELNRLVSTG